MCGHVHFHTCDADKCVCVYVWSRALPHVRCSHVFMCDHVHFHTCDAVMCGQVHRHMARCHTHLHKEDEVLKGGVEVGLFLQLHDGVKVLVVDVGIHPEQALQDGLRHGHEVLREWHTYRTAGEQTLRLRTAQYDDVKNQADLEQWFPTDHYTNRPLH